MTDVKYQNTPYFPLVESPGVIYLQKKQPPGNAAKAVMDAVLQGWPVLVLTLIMAALSGIVMWALVSNLLSTLGCLIQGLVLVNGGGGGNPSKKLINGAS